MRKESIIFKNRRLYYLKQQKLPTRVIYKECKNLNQGYRAIKELQVRGAPLIGVFAAYCVYISVKNIKSRNRRVFIRKLNKIMGRLESARPTAVNLSWALKRIKEKVELNKDKEVGGLKNLILKEAKNIHRQDIILCSKMAQAGIKLIKNKDRILTHCNTGFLATSGEGTALSVIYRASRRYKTIKVYVDETRPLLQGSRLTAWELMNRGIDATLISDNMAASLMQKKKIDKIFLGADRITAEGDVANKIGTYNLAVLANFHKIPFYVVAPSSSFDLKINKGVDIPIERRSPDEVRKVLDKIYIAPKKVKVYNPAFDITPHKLIIAIVTDRGVIYPPFKKNIKKLLPNK